MNVLSQSHRCNLVLAFIIDITFSQYSGRDALKFRKPPFLLKVNDGPRPDVNKGRFFQPILKFRSLIASLLSCVLFLRLIMCHNKALFASTHQFAQF